MGYLCVYSVTDGIEAGVDGVVGVGDPEPVGVDGRFKISRPQHGHAYPMTGEFHALCFRDQFHSGFGGTIDAAEGQSDHSCDTAYMQQMP